MYKNSIMELPKFLIERYQRGNSSYNDISVNNKFTRKYNLNLIKKTFCFFLCFIPVFTGFVIPFFQLFY